MSKNTEYISPELFENIDRYVAGKMNGKERMLFEARMKNDSELVSKVEEHRKLIFGVEEYSIRKEINSIHSEFFNNRKQPVYKSIFNQSARTFLMVASFLLLVAIGGYLLFFQKSYNERLFDANFTPDPGLPTVMSNTGEFEFYDAMVDYKRGNYQLAIQKWEEILMDKPQNDTLNYFLGMAWLAKNNEDKAINYLTKTLKTNNSVFESDTHFYLGLAYLKNDEIKKSIDSFKQSNNKQSQQILDKLNRIQ